jgi:dethiobiotin synthetase
VSGPGAPRRPRVVVVLTGTGTGVGKTWWTAATASLLRTEGLRVAARKPVQSFDPGDPAARDADVLAAATGERPERVCPAHRSYPLAWAPPMAADELGEPTITINQLVTEVSAADPGDADVADVADVMLVEGAGGSRSPLAADGDTTTLIGALRPDLVVVVADAGLGTIHAVRSTVDGIVGHPVVVALNRYDPASALHTRNREWLETRAGLAIVTAPAELAAALRP